MNNHIPYNKQQDAALRSALARRAGRCPQMPADLNERLMTRAEVQPQRTVRSILWPWAAVAACMLLLLMLHNTHTDSNTEAMDKMAMVQQQRMLDEADRSFLHTTIRCAMDIDETFSHNERLEDTDYQTNIYI